jgi:uncharacterized protein
VGRLGQHRLEEGIVIERAGQHGGHGHDVTCDEEANGPRVAHESVIPARRYLAAMLDDLISRLDRVAATRCAGTEPAHDYLHVRRVAESARHIASAEGADAVITVAAALLHELFNHPKGHPESHLSGEVCAAHATQVLREQGCPAALVEPIAYAIRVHPFSRGITPDTLEARVLQDADRLDAIGAIGIARCFATCADMKRPFYAPVDPLCVAREPDDKQWGVDHFFRKLLRIPERLHTETARRLASGRVAFMEGYLEQLGREITRGAT